MFGLFGIADSFVPWFYGDSYEKVKLLLKIVSLLTVAISINNVTGIEYLVPTKREKLYTRTVLIGAVINCCLNLILIPRFLSYGAAFASAVAELSIAGIQLFYVKNELDIKKIFAPAIKYLIAGVLMLALLLFEDRFIPSTIIGTLLRIVSGAALYFALLVVLVDTFFLENATIVINKVKKIIKRS